MGQGQSEDRWGKERGRANRLAEVTQVSKPLEEKSLWRGSRSCQRTPWASVPCPVNRQHDGATGVLRSRPRATVRVKSKALYNREKVIRVLCPLGKNPMMSPRAQQKASRRGARVRVALCAQLRAQRHCLPPRFSLPTSAVETGPPPSPRVSRRTGVRIASPLSARQPEIAHTEAGTHTVTTVSSGPRYPPAFPRSLLEEHLPFAILSDY